MRTMYESNFAIDFFLRAPKQQVKNESNPNFFGYDAIVTPMTRLYVPPVIS
jgi:hypothetical protein